MRISTAIKNSVINFLGLFKPSQFKEGYPWLTQQLGHITISFSFCVLTTTPYLVLLFWAFWEVRHLIKSGNWQDFFEDLLFESLGVVLFITLVTNVSIKDRLILLAALLLITIYTIVKFKMYNKDL
tara:strand:- start:113 stop:490 length:378 start_codon:yes stop_codon:yes gene_type:complete